MVSFRKSPPFPALAALLLVLCLGMAASAALAQPHGYRHGAYDRNSQISPEQQAIADTIMDEARPRIQELHQKLHDKMMELKTFSYDKDTDPEVLPRLGRELQALRDALRAELQVLDTRLEQEAGFNVRPRSGRGCSGLGPH